jgi:cytochrome c oxidase assembly protein subunit 15
LALARRLTLLGLTVLAVQLALGGWTSSNYAAIACPDFPTCQNAWWPHADFRNAFVPWRGLDYNYEGGVLDNSARIAIHLTHRLGAVLTAAALGLAALFVLRALPRESSLAAARPRAWLVLAALALQLTVGITMVLEGFPLGLATAHNAGAALLLLATLALLRALI